MRVQAAEPEHAFTAHLHDSTAAKSILGFESGPTDITQPAIDFAVTKAARTSQNI